MNAIREIRQFRRSVASVLLISWLLGVASAAHGEAFLSAASTEEDLFPCPPYLKSFYVDSSIGLTFFGVATMTMAQPDEYGGRIYTYEFIGYTVDRHQKLKGYAHIAPEMCFQAAYAYWRGITIEIGYLHNTTLYEVACNTGSGDSGYGAATDPYAADYDPLAPSDDPDEGCTDSQGSGSGQGSGTYYQPGDNTGGETVDWNTGQWNGGTSLCGSAATVEYICIDWWDGEKWVKWSCGFATTC